MKRLMKASAWLLVLSLCISALFLPVYAASTDTNLRYIFNDTAASSANQLFVYKSSIVTEPLDPAALDASKGTHYYAGNGNFSRFSSAHVWLTGANGEEPVCTDENGTAYYVGADHSIFESRNLYTNGYYMNGKYVDEKCYARWDYIQQFILADAITGELTTTYCADQVTSTQDGYYYTIENVEDADYYEPAQARKIRSIALNGYWGTDQGLGSLAALKEKLAATGNFSAAELSLLTDGVAMTATQYAIWSFSNQSNGSKPISAYYTDDSGNILQLDESSTASVDLLFKVYNYLVSLDPAAVEDTTADTIINKDNFLKNIGITAAKRIEDHPNNQDENADNDAYTVDLSFTMAVKPSTANGDNLVAKVVDPEGNVLAVGRIAGETQEGELAIQGDENGTYTFTGLEMIEGTQVLNIVLEGAQQLRQGVYLYTSEVRNGVSSQTLVGIAEGTHQVNEDLSWNIKFSVNEVDEPDRVINIHKQTNDGLALEGIQFDIYYVAGRSDYLSGKVELPEPADYPYNGMPDYTIITDSSGNGSFNLTENHMPDGVYLVVEQQHPAIVAPVAPFYIIMPATSEDGSQLVYTVDVRPKNQVRGNVIIEKDVISIGNDSATQDIYQPHTWIIGTSIPADIGLGKSFVISDTLDNRLDYAGNVRVRVENQSGTTVAATLTEGLDYILSVTDVDSLSEGKPSDAFTVSLTAAGMAKIESAMTTGIDRIRVYFDAQINANADMGVDIPNKAALSYSNSVGVDFYVESDIPEVHTGGIQLVKIDAADPDRKLSNAEFKVYRAATYAEIADESIVKEQIDGISTQMVSVEFFTDPTLTGEKTGTAVSDEDGNAYIYGLAYGTYYLVETKAPAGYNLLSDPQELTIHAASHLENSIITVENTSGTILPETGGIGTTVYIIPGLILMLAAAILLLLKKRKAG